MPADYEIGYGKPPPQARFRKGRSGNPRGRPKGTRNLKSDLQEELSERIPIRDQGRSRRISKQRALIKSLFARALQGNAAATTQLLQLILRVLGPEAVAEAAEAALTPEEQEILTLALARLGPGDAPESKGGAP